MVFGVFWVNLGDLGILGFKFVIGLWGLGLRCFLGFVNDLVFWVSRVWVLVAC